MRGFSHSKFNRKIEPLDVLLFRIQIGQLSEPIKAELEEAEQARDGAAEKAV